VDGGGEQTRARGEAPEPRRRGGRRRDGWAAFDRLFLVLLSIPVAIVVVLIALTVGVAAIANPVTLGVLLVILGMRSGQRARRDRDARRHRLRVEDHADLHDTSARRVQRPAAMPGDSDEAGGR
jgi:hypothetical protein